MGSVYTHMELSEMQEFNVLDTQPAEAIPLREDMESLLMMWLVGSTIFLGLLLILVVFICLSQRARYQRQLKAATVNAFGILSFFEMFTSDKAMTVTDDPYYCNIQRVKHLLKGLEKCTLPHTTICTDNCHIVTTNPKASFRNKRKYFVQYLVRPSEIDSTWHSPWEVKSYSASRKKTPTFYAICSSPHSHKDTIYFYL